METNTELEFSDIEDKIIEVSFFRKTDDKLINLTKELRSIKRIKWKLLN